MTEEVSLYASPVGYNIKTSFATSDTGRRLRILARLLERRNEIVYLRFGLAVVELFRSDEPITLGEVHVRLMDGLAGEGCRQLSGMPYRLKTTHDPEVASWLQDLADDWIVDVDEACGAFDRPDMYYPGIDPPLIEPVSDEHVSTVIAALQRELSREPRHKRGMPYIAENLMPAAPLAQLPPRIQRALVERRRYRYQQFGIGRREFESGTMSLWNVAEDPTWQPRPTASPPAPTVFEPTVNAWGDYWGVG